MGRAVIRTAHTCPGVTAFLYKIERLPNMAWTGVYPPAELVAVTALVRHICLCRIGRALMALNTKAGVLLCINGRAEQYEVIHTTNKVIKGVVAVGAVTYVIPCA
jgi:hypothetical protein